jgi:hypothetical protein
METKTHFDLSSALDAWRRQLLAQGEILPAEMRELESHLRLSIEGLKQLGLREDESFLLACRRLGHGEQIAAEFAKANPYRLWQNRLNWLTAGVMGAYLWTTGYSFFENVVCKNWNFGEDKWLAQMLAQIAVFAILCGGLVWFAATGARSCTRRVTRIFGSPWRIAFGWFFLVALGQVLTYVTCQYISRPSRGYDGGELLIGASIATFQESMNYAIWAALMVLATLALNSRSRKLMVKETHE